jgi:AGZA family xanthine/uracil permease-like MFS transporter
MRYHWARRGDVNAFFGLMLDNVAVMVILVTTISSSGDQASRDKFTPGFVLSHMIPGTALGVLFGDLVYTVMAFRLARRTGRSDVTAMPLGLDTPSTFGTAFLVLLPALGEGNKLFPDDHSRAMEFAWHVGLTVLVLVGVFKVICAPMGNAVRRLVPRAGLLGSLAAIALALIAFLPLLSEIAALPLVGMVALAIILLTLVAHRELPWKFPGALAAVLLGVAVYWLGLGAGLMPPPEQAVANSWQLFQLPNFTGKPEGWWSKVLAEALGKLPVALPFALATIVGGIDCTESAASVGDEYDTRSILMTEGVATLLAGFLGGVIQTTPYIGHPAYKKMGGAAAYTLANALFIGAIGTFGVFTMMFAWLPQAAMFPILVFVGIEITAQSFQATPVRHYPALAFAVLPALAYLIKIVLGQTMAAPEALSPKAVATVQTLHCLANGFIITSLLWAAALAMILDGKLVRAAGYFGVAGLAAFFGVIHSPLPSEQVNLPWEVLKMIPEKFREAVAYQTPFHWAAAYGLVAGLLVALSFFDRRGDASAEHVNSP